MYAATRASSRLLGRMTTRRFASSGAVPKPKLHSNKENFFRYVRNMERYSWNSDLSYLSHCPFLAVILQHTLL